MTDPIIDPEPFEVSEVRIKYGDSSWEGLKKMISTISINMEALVYDFHRKYGHVINHKPIVPSHVTTQLRMKLVEEEMDELLTALGDGDLVEIADAIADSLVVILGTAISYGIPIQNVFQEVHQSNMSKSTDKNEYGKTMKGENYRPPDVKKILGV